MKHALAATATQSGALGRRLLVASGVSICLFAGPSLAAAPARSPAGLLQSTSRSATPVVAPESSTVRAITTTLKLPRATWLNDRDQDKVFDSLEQRFAQLPDSRQRAVITFRYGADFHSSLDAALAVAGGFQPTYVYEHLGGFAGRVTSSQADALARLPQVRQVEWAQPGAPLLDAARRSSGVDAVRTRMGIDGSRDDEAHEFTGDDVVIAILDTGMDGDHHDLRGKFLTFIDWSRGRARAVKPFDTGDHGTHVASIAAGSGAADSGLEGVAPGASLIGFQIEDARGGTKEAVLASVDWLLGQRKEYRADIVTMSYGFGETVDGTDATELAYDRLFKAGILPFAAAGNWGPEAGTVATPAGARSAVAVASLHDPRSTAGRGVGKVDTAFYLGQYSSRGPTPDGRVKPDIAAPGDAIVAAEAGTVRGYTAKSGTSMASPFAAGVAALMLDADPALHSAQLRRLLYKTAEEWGASGADNEYGHGRIDALSAVRAAAGETPSGRKAPRSSDHLRRTVVVAPGGTLAVEIDGGDVGAPFSVTAICDYVGPLVDQTGRRLFLELLDPGDQSTGSAPVALQTPRQYVFNVPVRKKGSYVLRARNLGLAGVTLVFDVSAPGLRVRRHDRGGPPGQLMATVWRPLSAHGLEVLM